MRAKFWYLQVHPGPLYRFPWPNWTRRLTTNQKIAGSSPAGNAFLVFQTQRNCKAKAKTDPRGNRTPNLLIWNQTRYQLRHGVVFDFGTRVLAVPSPGSGSRWRVITLPVLSPSELRWQSGRLLTDRSLVRSQVGASFCLWE